MPRIDAALMTVVALLLARTPAKAQHDDHAAKSQLGTVHFATSCVPKVAADFDRAVAWLHSFEFAASARGFTDVLAQDSTCAMAYWGIALSRWSNPMAAGNKSVAQLTVGRDAAAQAMRLANAASAREQGYASAVNELYADFEHRDQRTRVAAYSRAMSDLVAAQPADTEAKIFYAISLAASASPTDKSYANQLKAGALLESLFVKQPNHPGLAHYIIHTYDYPTLAARADSAAARYADIAPSAAHAQHMPSHTFTRVGMWQESALANARSIDVALRNGAIAEALHAADYMEYAYLQSGKDSAAQSIVRRLPSLSEKFDPNAVTGAAPPSAGFFALAAIPARWALERRSWKEAAAIEPKATQYPWTESLSYFARSLGASFTGDLRRAAAANDSLGAIVQRLEAMHEPYWAEQTRIQRLSAAAWYLFAMGQRDSAVVLQRMAADREDATDKNAVTPGPLAPARELLGDMLIEEKRFREALDAYREVLLKEPNRYLALVGARNAAAKANDTATAQAYIRQLQHLRAHADPVARRDRD